jgi:hypothetical protein
MKLFTILCVWVVLLGGFLTLATAQTDNLDSLPILRDYTNHRVSSYDVTGANDDGNWQNPIQAGETRTIAEIEGPAIISHIWITISTPEQYHLKKIVLRMYWDEELTPSVEAPVGDFFGLGLGEYFFVRFGCIVGRFAKGVEHIFPNAVSTIGPNYGQ